MLLRGLIHYLLNRMNIERQNQNLHLHLLME